jgi:hypothetical protein
MRANEMSDKASWLTLNFPIAFIDKRALTAAAGRCQFWCQFVLEFGAV